jgi:hypothetical protein
MDEEAGMNVSKYWWLLSMNYTMADLVLSKADQKFRCYDWVEYQIS